MAQLPVIETLVAGEEGGPALLNEKPGQAVIFDTLLADVATDQERSDSPAP
jgi:hypothetical protein